MSIFSDAAIEKVSADPGVGYTAGPTPGAEQSIAAIQPADMLVPIRLDWRLNLNSEWKELNKVDRLRSFVTAVPTVLYEWEWRNRQIWVPSMASTGNNPDAYIRFRYQSLLPPIQFAGDQILLDNMVEALAYYMAADAYRSRGQHAQAQAMIGSLDPPPGFGAVAFLDKVIRQLTLNDQFTPRRGRPFQNVGGTGSKDFWF